MSKLKKSSFRGSLFNRWKEGKPLFQLMKDLKNGGYRKLSKNTILMIVIGLIYFILPTDVIVDAIPIVGLIDDTVVLGYILRQIKKDLTS